MKSLTVSLFLKPIPPKPGPLAASEGEVKGSNVEGGGEGRVRRREWRGEKSALDRASNHMSTPVKG